MKIEVGQKWEAYFIQKDHTNPRLEYVEVIRLGSEGVPPLVSLKFEGTTIRDVAFQLSDLLFCCYSLRDNVKNEPLEVELTKLIQPKKTFWRRKWHKLKLATKIVIESDFRWFDTKEGFDRHYGFTNDPEAWSDEWESMAVPG